MTDPIIGFLAALIGAVAVLIGTYLGGLQQSKTEFKKWLRNRDDEMEKELRTAIADLIQKMAVAAQTISWFSWEAAYYPDRINGDYIVQYDSEMKSLFPQIDSALILVSALNKEAYDDISPIVKRIYDLDLKVSRESRRLNSSHNESIQGIGSYKDEAFKLKREIMENVASVIQKYTKVEKSLV